MTATHRYILRITVLDAEERPEPPESTLRAIETYMGAMLTATGIHAAVTITPDPIIPALPMWECPVCYVRLPEAEGPYRACPSGHDDEED
jgi:hypothetical protein